MNKVILMGRLTKDPELTYSNNMTVAKYTLAVNSQSKDKKVNFIDCVCFGKLAEFAQKYLVKGQLISIAGSLEVSTYKTKDGKNVKSINVVVNEHHFTGSQK